MRQMAQDIELARNNAHMLIEAVSFADPELEAIEENELIKVRLGQRLRTESDCPFWSCGLTRLDSLTLTILIERIDAVNITN